MDLIELTNSANLDCAILVDLSVASGCGQYGGEEITALFPRSYNWTKRNSSVAIESRAETRTNRQTTKERDNLQLVIENKSKIRKYYKLRQDRSYKSAKNKSLYKQQIVVPL